MPNPDPYGVPESERAMCVLALLTCMTDGVAGVAGDASNTVSDAWLTYAKLLLAMHGADFWRLELAKYIHAMRHSTPSAP